MPPRVRIRCPAPAPRTVGATLRRREQHRLISSSTSSQPSSWRPLATPSPPCLMARRPYATKAVPVDPNAGGRLRLPDDYVPPTQPPSARRPEFRKSQLLRTYTSLLRSTPLTLIFQHNNVTPIEWAAIRRELRAALANVQLPAGAVPADGRGVAPEDVIGSIRLQVIRTRIFDRALKIVEFYDPAAAARQPTSSGKKAYTHDLSRAAFDTVEAVDVDSLPEDSQYAQIAPLLTGPVAVLTFPFVSPAHLAAALSILAPSAPAFPAPTRKKCPGYYEGHCQSGLFKLLLIGGRIEGRVFDSDGIKWVGGIPGGLDGLRAQLVSILQSAGMGLTAALEGAGKSLWLTMEGRRSMLEDEAKGAAAADGAEEHTKGGEE